MNWTIKTEKTVLGYPKAIMTLKVPEGVSGLQIIDAARTVVEKNKAAVPEVSLVLDYYYRDDDTYFVVGQQSMHSCQDLILAVDDPSTVNLTTLIHPKACYTLVRVDSHHWQGEKYGIHYKDIQIVDACRQFRDELKKLLNVTPPPGE